MPAFANEIASGQSELRCLLVDIAVEYMNPTRNLLPRLLAGACELTCFGPGYSSADELARGLAQFIETRGGFDLVLATEHILWADAIPAGTERALYDKFLFAGDRALIRYLPTLSRDFLALQARRIALLMESDYYNFQPDQIERLAQMDALVGWGTEFVAATGELPDLHRERFGAEANDNWRNFVSAIRERVISMPHYVGDDEFSFLPLTERRWNWSVPGTGYWARREVAQRLAHQTRPGKRLPIAPVLSRLGFHPYSWRWFLDYYRRTFQEEIRNARYSFTCGSGLRYPVRKFFEIPALGSLLVCSPCQGFAALGFRHMENAVCCDPSAILDVDAELRRNPDGAQAMAHAGRLLVVENHSVTARSQQLRAAFEKIIEGRYHGNQWRAGRFELMPPVAPVSEP